MSESQYKAYRIQQMKEKGIKPPKFEDDFDTGSSSFVQGHQMGSYA
jgi:hypothetical protein